MFSFTRRKIRLDFSTDDVECIDGKAYGMEFISSDPSVWKTFLNDFVKKWREVDADDADILSLRKRIRKNPVIDRGSGSVINDITAATRAQCVNDDLILRTDMTRKFIQSDGGVQRAHLLILMCPRKVSHDRQGRYIMSVRNVCCADKISVLAYDAVNHAAWHTLVCVDKRTLLGKRLAAFAAAIATIVIDIGHAGVWDPDEFLFSIPIDINV